jgi:PAS domain S-box-containing protein
VSLGAIDDGDGRLLAVRVRDLTEWRQADEVRRKSEERLAALLESAPDAVAIVDARGRIVLVNAMTEKLFGYERDELLGSSIDVLLPQRLREQHAHHRDVYVADPVTRPMGIYLDLFGCRKDGTEFPVDVSLSALETDEGILVTAFIRDVTDRKAEETVQRLREGWLGDLLESAPDAVVVSDEGGRIVLVNKQTEKLFGYRREELTGRPIETLVPERVRVPHAGDLADPEQPGMGEGLELAGLRKDGSEFPIEISLSTIETDQGQLVTSFVRDVTERLAREELERDLAERRALLAHLVSAGEEERSRIADDIHDDSIQAITAAGMRLQILRRSLVDPGQLELLGELEQTIQLSIARLRNLLFELRPPVLDNEGLSAALEMYLDVAQSETETTYRLEDRLRVQPPPETRTILYRIVLEALANARKHAAAATVTVSLDQREGGYLVRVADDGVGFAVEESTPVPGHLGLAAMRERAILAGGRLRIEAAHGSGTAVEVWIPEASEPVASGPVGRARDSGSSSPGRAA